MLAFFSQDFDLDFRFGRFGDVLTVLVRCSQGFRSSQTGSEHSEGEATLVRENSLVSQIQSIGAMAKQEMKELS